MRLLEAEIRNFRSISSETISFNPACRVLVGINESGKTNILRALALLDPSARATPDDLRDVGPEEDPNEPTEIRFVFATTMEERKNVYAILKTMIAGDPRRPIVKLKGTALSLGQLVSKCSELRYGVDLKSNGRWFEFAAEDIEVAAGWWAPAGGVSVMVTHEGERRNINALLVIDEEITSQINDDYYVEFKPEWLLGRIANAFGEVIELPSVVFWSYNEASLLPGSIPLDQFSNDPGSCVPLQQMFALAGHTDVAEAMTLAQQKKNGLTNLLNMVGLATTRHIVSVWKEFEGLAIELTKNGPEIEAAVKDAYNKFDLSRRSDGFKRFISFLLSVSAKARTNELANTLYLHDEPDTSLHPSGARYLRDELIHLSENNYVVYSTHSIFMIDRENLRRHLIVKKEHESTTVAEATVSNIVDEEVIYNALGYSTFEELKAKNILFEGWRDKRLFQVALKAMSETHSDKSSLKDVGVCHARGVSDVERVTPMLELARREWIIVSDADDRARQEQRKYDGNGPWYRYDELGASTDFVTSEDFIDWAVFDSPLKRIVSENGALAEPTSWDSLPGIGKIAKLKKWMGDSGLTVAQIKLYLEELKEQAFKNLTGTQIRAEYTPMMEEMAAKLRAL